MRRTKALLRVLAAFAEAPEARHWGYDLSRRSGVRSGVLYPILRRMLDEGWVWDGWEDPAILEGSRPPRRYYVLTTAGRDVLRDYLEGR